MMAKDPDDRRQEPADVIRGLKNILGEIKAAEAQAEAPSE